MPMSFEEVLFDSRTFLACMSAILFWETVMTLPKEYAIIWKEKKWGLVKVAYFGNKYAAVAGMCGYMAYMFTVIPEEECKRIHWVPFMFCLISMTFGDLILAVRLYALYQKKMWIYAAFGSLLTALVSSAIWSASQNFALPLPAGEKGCISMPSAKLAQYAYVPWVICCVCDISALSLTLFRIWRYKRVGGGTSPMFSLILNDGCIYFALVFSTKLATALNYKLNAANPSLVVPVAASIGSIMCGRLLFNMHDAQQRQTGLPTHSSKSWKAQVGPSTANTSFTSHNSVKVPYSPSTPRNVSYRGEDRVDLVDVKQALSEDEKGSI